jgi:hypothetical protein
LGVTGAETEAEIEAEAEEEEGEEEAAETVGGAVTVTAPEAAEIECAAVLLSFVGTPAGRVRISSMLLLARASGGDKDSECDRVRLATATMASGAQTEGSATSTADGGGEEEDEDREEVEGAEGAAAAVNERRFGGTVGRGETRTRSSVSSQGSTVLAFQLLHVDDGDVFTSAFVVECSCSGSGSNVGVVRAALI